MNLEGADRFVLITGCSGGGKSSLLEERARRGFATMEELARSGTMSTMSTS